MGKKAAILIAILIVVIVFAAASLIYFISHRDGRANNHNNKNPVQEIQENFRTSESSSRNIFVDSISCGDSNALFNVMPVSFDGIIALTPIGAMTPPDHVFPAPHLYMYTISPNSPEDISAKVYAPGNITLTQIGIRHYKKLNRAVNYTDYSLVFSRCRDVKLYFHHVSSLTYEPFIRAANEIKKACRFNGAKNEEFCSGQVNIPITEGTEIGTSGDLRAGVFGLDLGVRDYRIKNGKDFANPERICGQEKNVYSRCYAVCPFDYFPESIKEKLIYSDPGFIGKIPSENLSCGTIYADVKNTAQGYWFPKYPKNRQLFNSPEVYNLYIGPDSTKPSVNVFSIGLSVPNIEPGTYDFSPESAGTINRVPSQVLNDGKIYCYEIWDRRDFSQNKRVLILQMTGNSSLKIESVNDSECGNFFNFSSNAVEFVR